MSGTYFFQEYVGDFFCIISGLPDIEGYFS